LMIKDDEHLAAMVSEYLSSNGFEVTVAPGAERGLSLLARGAFQAVLLDVMLPDLDGSEVCRRVRARGDIPVLLLTARGVDPGRRRRPRALARRADGARARRRGGGLRPQHRRARVPHPGRDRG